MALRHKGTDFVRAEFKGLTDRFTTQCGGGSEPTAGDVEGLSLARAIQVLESRLKVVCLQSSPCTPRSQKARRTMFPPYVAGSQPLILRHLSIPTLNPTLSIPLLANFFGLSQCLVLISLPPSSTFHWPAKLPGIPLSLTHFLQVLILS